MDPLKVHFWELFTGQMLYISSPNSQCQSNEKLCAKILKCITNSLMKAISAHRKYAVNFYYYCLVLIWLLIKIIDCKFVKQLKWNDNRAQMFHYDLQHTEVTRTNLIIINHVIFLVHPLIKFLEIEQPQCIHLPSSVFNNTLKHEPNLQANTTDRYTWSHLVFVEPAQLYWSYSR